MKAGKCTVDSMYVGRFAPSPTGPLHFGSLVAALASWLDARAAAGRWLLRIEDLDAARNQPGAARSIIDTLARLGLEWDGEIIYQSRRRELYQQALEAMRSHTYWCACTRREIADSSVALAVDGAQIYPGTCRTGLAAGKTPRALRVKVDRRPISYVDRLQGAQQQVLERDVGDFVLLRADGQYAYQLAVVVDDALQGITDVVRGADLIESTPRQLWLQGLLGYRAPRYLHVPAAVNGAGEKLSKQTGAAAVDPARRGDALRRALAYLGQPPTEDLACAVRAWDPSLVPARRVLAAEP